MTSARSGAEARYRDGMRKARVGTWLVVLAGVGVAGAAAGGAAHVVFGAPGGAPAATVATGGASAAVATTAAGPDAMATARSPNAAAVTATARSLSAAAVTATARSLSAAVGALAHDDVEGDPVDAFTVRERTRAGASPDAGTVSFDELQRPRAPGPYELGFAASGAFVRIPHCAGRKRVRVDGVVRDGGTAGPLVLSLEGASPHDVRVDVDVSKYEKRIACGERPRVGRRITTHEGLGTLTFASPHASTPTPSAGGGEAVVYVPPGHDVTKPGALLVGLHPWNGSPWTYAAYRELLERAGAKDVVLLQPSGLGNSLYTRAAEDEVMRAIDALAKVVAVDPQRVSVWGASMGGAGATTIAFHRPDRFAFVTSYFGDSRYDRTTYVRSLLPTEADARMVNALDVVENARHLPVWLVHGEADTTSKIEQSTMLADAMRARGMNVTFDRAPGMGHEAPLVVRTLRQVVDRAATARAPVHPARVSYRSVRKEDVGAYGVRIERTGTGDAFVDIERIDRAIVVHRAEGVRVVTLEPGALGTRGDEAVRVETRAKGVVVRWANGVQIFENNEQSTSKTSEGAP